MKEVLISCDDGRRLSSRVFATKEYKAAVMLGGATGIKKEFYTPFAKYLCDNGFGVITFDFRGVGESSLQDPRQDNADILDWGSQGMPAILDELQKQFPNTSYHLIGHSAGGQLTGLMPNYSRLKSQVNFACSTGKLSNMKAPFWFKAQFFMRVFIPFSNSIFGYGKLHLVNMGERIPKRVAQQWAQWCSTEGYIKAALGKEIKEHFYNELQMPILWINAEDDPIANDINVEEIIRLHPNTQSKRLKLYPEQAAIGHMKFFSRKNKHLWDHALEWLKTYSN